MHHKCIDTLSVQDGSTIKQQQKVNKNNMEQFLIYFPAGESQPDGIMWRSAQCAEKHFILFLVC